MGEIIDIRELMAGIEVEDVTKKEFLKRYKPIMGRIEAKMEQIERMENSLFPGAQILSGMPGGGQAGDGMDKTISVMDHLKKLRGQILSEVQELESVRADILAAINAIDDETMRQLLEERYINFHSWRMIARKMNYSEDNIYKLHAAALKKLRIKKRRAA